MGRRALLHKGNASKVLAKASRLVRKAKVRAVHGRIVAHVPKEDPAQKDNVVHGPREAHGQKAREVAIAARGQRGSKAHGRSVAHGRKVKVLVPIAVHAQKGKEAVAAVAVAEGVAIVHQAVVERERHPILH